MGEPLHEQIGYGSYCRHGTNIGTPGGADLMCGYCEMGLTKWVADPLYRLYIHGQVPIPMVSWRLSEINTVLTMSVKRRIVHLKRLGRVAAEAQWELEMVEIESGYWEEA